MNAEQAGQQAIEYLKKMGFTFIQVLNSSYEMMGKEQVWRLEADVGYMRKRLARVWIKPDTGEVLKHEVDA
jgi:hypothetical protein